MTGRKDRRAGVAQRHERADRRARPPVGASGLGRRIATTALVLVALAVAVVVADRERRVVDLTEDDVLTLAPQTEDVLRSVDRDVDITLFARPDEPGRVEAVSLLDRYRRSQRRIDVEVRDPDRSPGEAARAGIDPLLGGVVVETGERREVVPFPTEGGLTGAVARLLREEPAVVCLSTGHGERAVDDPGGTGIARLADLLGRDGYQVEVVDLLAAPEPPERCTVLLVAGPTAALRAETERALGRWVAADGRLLLLADPAAVEAPLAGVLDDLGIRVERGVVFEGDAGNVVGGDVSAPIVDRFPSASPVTRRLAPIVLPVVQGVVADPRPDEPGLTVTELATTSEQSYLERNPVTPSFDEGEDVAGPVPVAVAADRSRVDGADVRRTRVVVVGDVDLAADDAVGEAGNAQLLRQAVAWLTESEDLVAISPNLPADRPLRLTDARLAYARLLTAAVVPALLLLAGVLVWAVRRGR